MRTVIQLPDVGLEGRVAGSLAGYQAEVDAAGDYGARVRRGKVLFSQRNKRSNSTFREVRRSLTRLCSGAQRCVYCEDSVGDEVEHIQPKDLYPCLVFVWSNYVYACGRCNGAKSNKFAVIAGGRLKDATRGRNAPVTPPPPGQPVFLNPRVDDPLDFLHLDLGTFFVVAREGGRVLDQERAEFTIEALNLNRDVLMHARAGAFGAYRARLFEYVRKRDQVEIAKRQAMIEGLMTTSHPTVWAEMKRQRASIPELGELFARAPEALAW